MKRRLASCLQIAAAIVVLCALGAGIVHFQHRYFTRTKTVRTFQERMYLPDSHKLQLVTLGFDHLYADLLWLRAIQAFGARWQTGGGDMSPIFHYFDVITDLDPQFVEAYKLGNLVIGDEGGDYPKSLAILRKGMIQNPWSWEIPYLGIYNAVWQMGDYEQGRWFSYMAERVPNRPEFVARMREYVERQSGKYDLAYRLNLEYMLRYIDEQNEVEARLTSIRFWDILNRWNLSEMIQAARRFIEAEGRDPRSLEELVKSSAWKALQLPTMESLRDTINRYRDVPPSLQAHLDAIAREAIIPIPGAPPEPNGYSYRIIESLIPKDGETTGTLPVTRENAFQLPDSHFAYIINEYDTRERMREYLAAIGVEIDKFRQNNGRWPESLEELTGGRFEYNDLLGGTILYDPETGIVRSTGLDQTKARREQIYIY